MPESERSLNAKTIELSGARRDWFFNAAAVLPAPMLLLGSILSIQLGNALATTLFRRAGVVDVVLMRAGFAALVLWLVAHPRLTRYSSRHWRYAALLGVVTVAMNLAFYSATARIPLGVAMAVDFLGPVTVAVAGSRRPRELIWPVLAYGGVLLLTPLSGLSSLDPLGLIFALCAAVGWASYVVLTARTSEMFDGTAGLTLATTFGTLALIPLALTRGRMPVDGQLIAAGFVVAMLSTALPFALEFVVLRRMAKRMFGVLLSAEPAVAALIGLIVLKQTLATHEWIAILLVSVAAIGVTVTPRPAGEKG